MAAAAAAAVYRPIVVTPAADYIAVANIHA